MDESGDPVILVDDQDRELGEMGKMAAHLRGQLHRAISVCVYDPRGRMLLQRRAEQKYHSGGLWTNACCTHPRPGESIERAARRRLGEELGIDVPLRYLLRTHYRADVGSGLVENEIVHLFIGLHSGSVIPNPDEVAEFAWAREHDLRADVAHSPAAYTYWFKHYLEAYGDALFGQSPAPQAA